MAGTFVPLVLVPRYTTYAGDTSFSTVAMDVSEYSKATLSFWRSVGANLTSVAATYEESTDQVTWTTCGGGPFNTPSANTEEQHQPTLTKRWFRIVLTLTGTDAVVTCWCIGFLEMRES
jgi:hypothetical protein